MPRLSSNAFSLIFVGAGAVAWGIIAHPLEQEPELRIPANPLGIKRSPYGEVLAMAMQTPISEVWHSGVEGHEGHHHAPDEPCEEDHDHGAEESETAPAQPAPSIGLRGQFHALLEQLNEAATIRTNPKPPTEAHKFAMRRKVEDQLRFAYELDPAHYGNYNSYLFFLTQPTIGTRPELTREALTLTENTIRYCLARTDDPRPALTAAAAIENELMMMFSEPGRHSLATIQRKLDLLNFSLNRHREIRAAWIASGNWDLLSHARQQEIDERFRFTSKLRDAAATTVKRLSHESLGLELNPPGPPSALAR